MVHTFERKPAGRTWSLGDVLSFGKHEGRKIDNVIRDEPRYLEWCLDNIEGFDLDEEAAQLLHASMV